MGATFLLPKNRCTYASVAVVSSVGASSTPRFRLKANTALARRSPHLVERGDSTKGVLRSAGSASLNMSTVVGSSPPVANFTKTLAKRVWLEHEHEISLQGFVVVVVVDVSVDVVC